MSGVINPAEAPTNGIEAMPIVIGKFFVYDGDMRRILVVGVAEITSAEQRDSHGPEIIRGYEIHPCGWSFLARCGLIIVDFQSGGVAVVTHGNGHRQACRFNARQDARTA